MRSAYIEPVLTRYGAVADLTMGQFFSDTDGNSGMIGNRSDSDPNGTGNANDGTQDGGNP